MPINVIMTAMKNKFIFTLLLCFLIFSCKQEPNAYLTDNMGELEEKQKTLLAVLSKTKNTEASFAIKDKIARNLKLKDKKKSLIIFLSSLIENDKENAYKGYWLLMLANEYLEQNMYEPATYYFERIIKLEHDMEISGKSVQYLSLKNLINITQEPKRLVEYYSMLLANFYDKIDPAYSYFMLAQNYEKLGEWNPAIQSYSKFISLGRFDLVIPGIPDNYGYARKIVDYSASTKSWTMENLDELVKIIQAGIAKSDYVTLEKYRSKVNFFSMAWKQELSDIYGSPDFDLKNFMYGKHIRIESKLDPSSTPYEAYLRTSGWNQYSSIWYLYFRKVNFPADPEIHGRWEWAGIYYGEKI
nr:tetratricopeptide repeat protein [Treponema pedis]